MNAGVITTADEVAAVAYLWIGAPVETLSMQAHSAPM
jgi:hypothetical protein